MADWPDVMDARGEATKARENALALAEELAAGSNSGAASDAARATLLASEAICAEIRALAVALAFESRA